jgi:very-short-patch-repair endonuclease
MRITEPNAARILSARYWWTRELKADGWTARQLRAAVDAGLLVRLRRGQYAEATLPEPLLQSGRLGARATCRTLLVLLGVFVRTVAGLQVQWDRGASRLPPRDAEVQGRWRAPASHPQSLAASLVEALACAVRCQSPRDAVATLDSAWHLGLVDEDDIARVFELLPRRYGGLRPLLDARSESGPETLMRLLLRTLGCDVDVQVSIPSVGRVDFVVDGWLIVECDSRAFHEGWEKQRADRRRDLAAAALGYTTVRPLAEDILFRHDKVQATMKAIVAAHRR